MTNDTSQFEHLHVALKLLNDRQARLHKPGQCSVIEYPGDPTPRVPGSPVIQWPHRITAATCAFNVIMSLCTYIHL